MVEEAGLLDPQRARAVDRPRTGQLVAVREADELPAVVGKIEEVAARRVS
jgi:hypothetical protein